jgi:hypothetical protein
MDFDKNNVIDKINDSKIKKKYKKKITLFYKKSYIEEEFVTKPNGIFNVSISRTKLYDKKFKKHVSNSISNITCWKTNSNELIQEYTTIFLKDGTITFFSSSIENINGISDGITNLINNKKRFNDENKYIWKINSGTNKYLDISGYVKFSISDDICSIKILYEYEPI